MLDSMMLHCSCEYVDWLIEMKPSSCHLRRGNATIFINLDDRDTYDNRTIYLILYSKMLPEVGKLLFSTLQMCSTVLLVYRTISFYL